MQQVIAKEGIFSSKYRSLTFGIILAVSTVAFEGLAITTIAPEIARDLNGIHLYSWIFSSFLLVQLIGTIITGQQIGKFGMLKSFIISNLIFTTGIVIAALSHSMVLLAIGRAFQGFGAGAIITCVYYSISKNYPNHLRTKILAVFSGAYVLPALIGPYAAGLAAEHYSWRSVFWFVLPLIAIVMALTTPSFKKIKEDRQGAPSNFRKEGLVLVVALGTGLLLFGLNSITEWRGVILAAVGILVMAWPLKNLLPSGTMKLKRGLPAIVVSRGFYLAAYIATESYIVLALTEVKGLSADKAGLIVAAGGVSWSFAAWVQSKLDERADGQQREQRVTAGLGIMTLGIMFAVTAIGMTEAGIAFSIISQIFIGFGIGLANPTAGALALSHAGPGEEGEVSGLLQFMDALCPGLSIGLGGALVATAVIMDWGMYTGLMLALGLQLLIGILSFLISFRIKTS